MCSLLAKRVISCHFLPSSPYHRLLFLNPLLRFSLSTQTQPQKELPFIAEYLISSFGFSPDRALKVSRRRLLTTIRSPDRPEAVVKFLTDTGLSGGQIKNAVSFFPTLLGYKVDKTMKPNIRKLLENGFSRELLVQLIPINPQILLTNVALSRLLFWKDFVSNRDEVLSKMILRQRLLLSRNTERTIVPVMKLLKEYGLSKQDIVSLLLSGNWFIRQNVDAFRQTLELLEEVGIPRGSRMFVVGLKAVGSTSQDTLQRKLEFFKRTYGLSQEELYSACRKFPSLLSYSEDKVKSKMNFLMRKVGFHARLIASQPRLLGCSLENVLMPRNIVLSALKDNRLKEKCNFFTAAVMPERRFREIYVVPFEKYLPGLGEAYVASFGRKPPV